MQRHLCAKWPTYFGACEEGAPYYGTGRGGSIPVRVHEDEATALDYIAQTQARGTERTWALISFASLTPVDLDYTAPYPNPPLHPHPFPHPHPHPHLHPNPNPNPNPNPIPNP